jgi:hypothetical protein
MNNNSSCFGRFLGMLKSEDLTLDPSPHGEGDRAANP